RPLPALAAWHVVAPWDNSGGLARAFESCFCTAPLGDGCDGIAVAISDSLPSRPTFSTISRVTRMLMSTSKTFRLILIKRSHYDKDGFVIRWWRGGLPSNSLACLYGIALDCRDRQILGADFDIDIEAIDETNWKVRVEDLTRSIKEADAGMVMLVG